VRGLVDWYRSKLVTVDAPEDGVARIYLQSGAVARIDLDMLRREGYIQIGLEADLERMQHTTEATRIDKVCGIALVSLRKVESGHAPRLGPGEANARTCPPKAH
jgi:hypothetical protein